MPLFIRDRRRVELTDSGRLFLQEARIIVNPVLNAVDAVRRAAKGASGFVRIGIGSGLGEPVKRALIEHAMRLPKVETECKDRASVS